MKADNGKVLLLLGLAALLVLSGGGSDAKAETLEPGADPIKRPSKPPRRPPPAPNFHARKAL